jgi:DNA-binding NarL/FixJ family response regulator
MNLLIADDHHLVREGLRHMLAGHFEDLDILEAKDAQEVLDIAAKHQRQLDLILLDLYMPGVQGFSLLSVLCSTYPDLPVMILSASSDPIVMHKALDYGASGFITKSTDSDVIIHALRLALAGGVYLPPSIIESPGSDEHVVNPETQAHEPTSLRAIQVLNQLTRRQRQVLSLLLSAKSNKEISATLHLSESTVKGHVAAIFRVLGATSRTQAVLEAQKLGFPS